MGMWGSQLEEDGVLSGNEAGQQGQGVEKTGGGRRTWMEILAGMAGWVGISDGGGREGVRDREWLVSGGCGEDGGLAGSQGPGMMGPGECGSPGSPGGSRGWQGLRLQIPGMAGPGTVGSQGRVSGGGGSLGWGPGARGPGSGRGPPVRRDALRAEPLAHQEVHVAQHLVVEEEGEALLHRGLGGLPVVHGLAQQRRRPRLLGRPLPARRGLRARP